MLLCSLILYFICFVEFRVKYIKCDFRSKSSVIILNIQIFQGSVAEVRLNSES